MTRVARGIGLLVALAAVPAAAEESPADRTACIQPLGKYDKGLIDPLVAGIRYVYGIQVRVLDGEKLPKTAYYQPRRRYRAEKLLDWIDANVTDDSCDWVIGFTAVDISTTKGDIEDWGILGLGNIGGHSCVVSSYRMKRKVKRLVVKKRAVKVGVHELGHVLGLQHFNKAGCVMNDAQGTVKTVDTEDGVLCEESRAKLKKRWGFAFPERTEMDWGVILR